MNDVTQNKKPLSSLPYPKLIKGQKAGDRYETRICGIKCYSDTQIKPKTENVTLFRSKTGYSILYTGPVTNDKIKLLDKSGATIYEGQMRNLLPYNTTMRTSILKSYNDIIQNHTNAPENEHCLPCKELQSDDKDLKHSLQTHKSDDTREHMERRSKAIRKTAKKPFSVKEYLSTLKLTNEEIQEDLDKIRKLSKKI